MVKRRDSDNWDPGEVNIATALDRLNATAPDGLLAYSIHQKRGITHAAMYSLCNRIAHLLAARGLGANDRVILLGGNSLEYLIFYCGVWRAGLAITTVNTEMNAGYLKEIIAAVAPKLVLYEAAFDPAPFEDAAPGADWLRYGEWGDADAAPDDLFALIQSQPDDGAIRPAGGPDDIAAIAFTSGTSAKPKGVVYSYRAMMANGISTSIANDVGADDRLLEFRALSWASARARLLTALCTGAVMVIAEKFSRSQFFAWLGAHDITVAFCVPAVINMLLEKPEDVTKADLPALRFITSSTAPLPIETQRRFESQYGIPVIIFYGMSEAGNLACNPPDAPRAGSAGKPAYLQDVQILGPGGVFLPAGETGEISTSGPQLAWGYLMDDGGLEPLGTDRLTTGDIGHLDADGYLFITGRAKDVIIRGGANIHPLEIDNVLLEHPGIAEAATVGIPDKIYGEEVVSYVVVKDGATPDQAALDAHCAERLPAAKRPKQLIFVAKLARNDRGKIDRGAMRAHYLKTHQPT